jgi:hypothetical protein
MSLLAFALFASFYLSKCVLNGLKELFIDVSVKFLSSFLLFQKSMNFFLTFPFITIYLLSSLSSRPARSLFA